MGERFFHDLKKAGIVGILAFLYYLFIRISGFAVPCYIYVLTGLKCPGCGISRMLIALSRFDLKAAFAYNPFCFVALPILAVIFLLQEYRYIKNGIRKYTRFENAVLYVLIAAAVLFGILRNIPALDWQAAFRAEAFVPVSNELFIMFSHFL